MLKTTHTEDRSVHTNSDRCNILQQAYTPSHFSRTLPLISHDLSIHGVTPLIHNGGFNFFQVTFLMIFFLEKLSVYL